MTRCFSFVAPSLSPWVGKVLPPWAGQFSVGLGPAVFRFWPVAVCWLFCGGRVSVGPAVFQACAVGRASVGLAVFQGQGWPCCALAGAVLRWGKTFLHRP